MDTFQTRSTARKNARIVLLTFVPLFALAFLGLKIAVFTWLFFEIILLITFAFCLFIVLRTYMELAFSGSVLILTNTGNGRRYRFEDLARSDFLITQSSRQKERNVCDLRIQGAPFYMYDVQNCEELRTYIRKHFD